MNETQFDSVVCKQLTIVDNEGTPRITMGTLNEGWSAIHIADNGGEISITVGNGVANIVILDKTGEPRATIGSSRDGDGKIAVRDSNGMTIWRIPESAPLVGD